MSRKLSVNSLISCSDWERKAGSLPTEVLGFGALSELFDFCGLPLLFKSLLISWVEEVRDQQLQTWVSKSMIRLCLWGIVCVWRICGLTLSRFFRGKTGLYCFFFVCFFSAQQVVYFTEMYKVFSELTDQIDQAGLTDEQRAKETEAKLSELRALSIVADDWGRKAEYREVFFSSLWMDSSL